MKNRHKIKLRIAGISALILSLIIGTWPVIVRAAEDTTWQNDFSYTLDATAQTITLNRYNFPSAYSDYDLIIPATAVISGVEYKTCLGNPSYGDPSDPSTVLGVF